MSRIVLISLIALFAGCTTFNRSALWCLSLKESYATYNPSQDKVGNVYTHLKDDWTDARLTNKTELVVKDIIDDNTVVVAINWYINDYQMIEDVRYHGMDGLWISSPAFTKNELKVVTLKKHNLKKGDFFNVYGQYVFEGYSNNKKVLKQINEEQTYIFKEPFIQF